MKAESASKEAEGQSGQKLSKLNSKNINKTPKETNKPKLGAMPSGTFISCSYF